MLTLRQGQWDALVTAARESFISEVCVEVRQQHPEKVSGTSESDVRQQVFLLIQDAESAGLKSKVMIKEFALMSVEFGRGFRESPSWEEILAVLRKSDLHEALKVREISRLVGKAT